MTYSFTFYWNAQRDDQGHLVGFLDGYRPGHKLEIAYRGFVKVSEEDKARLQPDLFTVADVLFAVFNEDGRRPSSYRGPSMSVGNVIEIQGRCFAVAPIGFESVEIWESEIAPCDPRWIASAYQQELLR